MVKTNQIFFIHRRHIRWEVHTSFKTFAVFTMLNKAPVNLSVLVSVITTVRHGNRVSEASTITPGAGSGTVTPIGPAHAANFISDPFRKTGIPANLLLEKFCFKALVRSFRWPPFLTPMLVGFGW